jgi:hypothetical protein
MKIGFICVISSSDFMKNEFRIESGKWIRPLNHDVFCLGFCAVINSGKVEGKKYVLWGYIGDLFYLFVVDLKTLSILDYIMPMYRLYI